MTGRDRFTRRSVLRSVGLTGVALAASSGTAAAGRGRSTTPARDVNVLEGITYAERDGGDLKLDLYLPESDGPTPLVVYVHGGGWLVNTRKSTPDLHTYFASRGYAMATIDYRLSVIPEGVDPVVQPDPDNHTPRGVFPDHIVDVKAAIRWLRSHASEYGLDPENVGIWGSSSGAHLAALAGTAADVEEIEGDGVYEIEKTVAPEEPGHVQAVVGWYTPTDFLQMDEQLGGAGFSHDAPDSPESLLVGGQITEHPTRVERANPITYVTPDDPPFMLMHGREDVIVPYEQSEILYEALRDGCVEATFYELQDLGHGFGFDALTDRPAPDQTVTATSAGCDFVCGRGSRPGERTSHGPPAGPRVIEQFLDRHLTR